MKYQTRHILYWVLHFVVFVIGIAMARSESILMVGIGSSLIAAGIAGAVIFFYVQESERVGSLLEALNEFGLRKIYSVRVVLTRGAQSVEGPGSPSQP